LAAKNRGERRKKERKSTIDRHTPYNSAAVLLLSFKKKKSSGDSKKFWQRLFSVYLEKFSVYTEKFSVYTEKFSVYTEKSRFSHKYTHAKILAATLLCLESVRACVREERAREGKRE